MARNWMKLRVVILLVISFSTLSIKQRSCFQWNRLKKVVTFITSCSIWITNPMNSNAGMFTFPLPSPLKNNIVFMRSGESFSDARHEIQTNPAKKLRQDNALTFKGREQVLEAAKRLSEENFIPTYIWVSNTERAYETATILARVFQIGQNRIVPEFTFLDARAVGQYEGKSTDYWKEIHQHDELDGVKYKPAPTDDGTPSDSVTDVLVRGNQLLSTVESMYSGENVIIVSPDSDVLSVLEAAMSDDNPDHALPYHAKFTYENGEFRVLHPLVRPRELLVTGQTQSEANAVTRKVTVMRYMGESKNVKQSEKIENWFDLWRRSIDNE